MPESRLTTLCNPNVHNCSQNHQEMKRHKHAECKDNNGNIPRTYHNSTRWHNINSNLLASQPFHDLNLTN